MTVEIVYETHSITTDNEAGFATGWLPGQLSDAGRKLARELGQRRRADGIAFLSEAARDWDAQKVLLIAHSANRWALEHLLNGVALEDLVDAPFSWQEGWHYTLPTGWTGQQPRRSASL